MASPPETSRLHYDSIVAKMNRIPGDRTALECAAMASSPSDLPVAAVLPELLARLADGRNAVLRAPPGAGKTTLVPLALLDAPWLAGKVVMLEPRRLAARAAARRMAGLLGEEVGQTVGYRVRLDSRVGPQTRIEVVTDGIFTRLIQRDPSLAGIGAVLFDEIHERSLEVDLGLAFALEVQNALREDLRLVAMSATLDVARIARLLGDAPVVACEGRLHRVETRYLGAPQDGRLADAAVAAVRRALTEQSGDVLVFLPGAREIRRAASLLEDAGLPPDIGVHVLHGDLPQAQQDAAIRPAPPGRRKIVLATTIAETSLTIEGVTAVVDGGYARASRFDPASGMSRLVTVRVSQAAAEQRRGRAGRLAPGLCYRLWSEAAQHALVPQTTPEILEADLAPLALELARWGAPDAAGLAWLDPPPLAALSQARDLLLRLGAIDARGAITAHGRSMAELGLHPRLAHMAIRGEELGHGRLACWVAALLEERDLLRPSAGAPRDADLRLRLDLLAADEDDGRVDRAACRRVLQLAKQWARRLKPRPERPARADTAGALLALAYPDRIAQRRPGLSGQFRLSNGRGAMLPPEEPLAAADYLVAAELDGDRREARIFLAAPVDRAWLEAAFADQIETQEFVAWDRREQAVLARRQRRLGALVLEDERLDKPEAPAVRQALLDGIRDEGLSILPFDPACETLRARVAFLRRIEGDKAGWPDLSDAALLDRLAEWLGPYVDGISRRAQLRQIDLLAALEAQLDWQQRRRLDEGAPTHLTVPSGSRIALDYSGELPVLAVRLQEMFGQAETPTVYWGQVPVLVRLLSPAGRPAQVTRDLAGFWRTGYRAVRAELRGRYPKHFWPDDPLTAPATRRTRPQPR